MVDVPDKPSIDPGLTGSLSGVLTHVLRKAVQGIDNALPAWVVAFDRARNLATVRPAVQIVGTNGGALTRAQLAEIAVVQIGAGGGVLNFPLEPGDFGYIHACDRDISLMMQQFADAPPNTQRLHSFSDGFFIPVVTRSFTIAGEDAAAPVYQRLDGSVRLALHEDHAKVTAERGLMVADIDGQPEEDVLFQVESTARAARPWPVMTEAQRDAIATPKSGMAVWVKDGALDYLSTYSEVAGDWS